MAYLFCALADLPSPPPCGQPIQLLGRLVVEDDSVWLAAPAAPVGAGAGAPPPPPPPPRLFVDTSLLPAHDVHRAAKAGLVHALGVLRMEVGGGGGGAARPVLQAEALRLAEGADCAAGARAVRERGQLLRECG